MSILKFLLPSLLKTGLAIAGLILAAYLVLCAYLLFRQNRLIFFPSPLLEVTPAELGIAYEEVWLPVNGGFSTAVEVGGDRIHGWWMPAQSRAASSNKVLLYLHGNGGNIGDNLVHAGRFHQLGFSVLLIDYRGYGLSQGSFPTEQSVYEDAETAWRYLTQVRGVAPEQIYLYGHSLGGAIAIELASRHPDAAGLIVQGSFTSMHAMASWLGQYRLIPVQLLLRHRFDSIDKVNSLQMPVLFIHGIDDTEVPASMSQQLYETAPDPKQLWLVPQANHNDVATVTGLEYLHRIQQFVALVQAHQPAPVRP